MENARTSTPAERARQLVLHHGWNTTAYQILNPGFAHWFSAAGDGVIGHVRRGRVWVVGGAPVCEPERLDAIAAEFEEEARRAGARVCYVGAQDRLARRCLAHPEYAATILGAEPWWDPAEWPALMAGRPSLRAQRNRARNKGVTVATEPVHPDAVLRLEAPLLEWLRARGLPPLAFLTTPWLLADLRDRKVFVAERGGAPVGFLVLTPIPGRQGWLVEQIVRGREAPNGTAELLVDAAFQWMGATGARYATLGLAPLADPGVARPRPDPWWLAASLGWLRLHGRRFYNFEGLRSFKAKLGPLGWSPVYAIANERRIGFGTMLGVAEAVVGGDLVRFGGQMLRHALTTEVHRMTTGAP